MKEDKSPLMVSIKCITYNHEPYIRQCLDGFMMQKTHFRFEVIVHDDASTDNTPAIIHEYAEKFPEIIKPIFEIENQYSKGDGSIDRIMDAACTGKYIALCEGDDYWTDPLKLQKQVDFLESHDDYTLIGGNANIYTSDGRFLKTFSDMESNDLTMNTIINGWTIPTASMLYRITVNKRIPYIKNAPQGDIIIQMACADLGKCRYESTVCCVYRWMVPGSSTARVRNNQLDYYLRHYDMWVKLNEYFEYKYDKAIQNKLKKTNRKIIRERIYLKYPMLKKMREIYRSFRGY